MKTLTQHITERLILNKDRVSKYEYFPKTKEDLGGAIDKIIRNHRNDEIINLNMIDTSKITSMSCLFYKSRYNYDISEWNVSQVKDMGYMFYGSSFNNDISQWNISNVENMDNMFENSDFNQDLTAWKDKIKNKDLLKYIQDYIK